ncbi:hypothetical protein F7734_59805 [Scytonema sp. UIC 10036]|nr:hypothetical protein [Scytonema sp. UIC 10036]MUH01777.1 hypothetical protein [Scytonema sp. UIC 10036]
MKKRAKKSEENSFIPNLHHMSKEEVLATFEPYTRVMDNEDTLIFQLKKPGTRENPAVCFF